MEDFQKKYRKIINFFIAVFIIALIITIICLIMLKYEVEGENNMPFELSQMVIVSTAEGIGIEGDATWNFDLVQNNDVYLHISKNKNYKETEIIKNIVIDNFKIDKANKGNTVLYRPSIDENKNFEYSDKYIIDNCIAYGIGKCTQEEIDKYNILEATKIAMKRAIDKVNKKINLDYVLIDGNMKFDFDYKYKSIVKGDSKSISISAASIIAKVTRDRMLIELDKKYPMYGFKNHKGYPTKKHLDAIKKYGLIDGYRMSYGPIKEVINERSTN